MKKTRPASFTTIALLAVFLTAGAHAATIVIQNNDSAGEGFNDATAAAPVGGNYGTTIGQQRLIAFTYAANIWAACLQSVPPITVAAQMNPLTCNATSAVLGSAGTTEVFRDFVGAPLAATWYPHALANALFGADLDPATAEISAQFNSNLGNAGCLTGIPWYYGLDGNPPPSTIDFVSVVTHEIGHGLGFQTFISQTGVRLAGFNDDYMVFLENHGAVPPGYPAMTDAQRAAGNIADPNLHWIGALVTAKGLSILSAGTSGGHVRMHGPNPFQAGSSVSHWSTALSPDQLMEPIYTGANHDPGLAWTLINEIGWTLVNKVTDGCDGAVLNLAATGATNTGGGNPDSFQDRGVFVTALKDFTLCSLGVEANLIPGENITATVYAATGTARGALLGSFTTKVEFAGLRTHYIPLSVALKACKEYDLVVHWDHVTSWPWWSELVITEPYDVGGVIRVRDGEANGGAGNFALGHFTLQGTSPSPQNQTDLAANASCVSFPNEWGAFVTAAKTISVCRLGVTATFASSPTTVRAYVYNASGNVRGTLVAEGSVAFGAVGHQVVSIPINAVMREGQQYDVGFVFGGAALLTKDCRSSALPFLFSDLWNVQSLETSGVANGTTAVPDFHVSWNEGNGGEPLDLVGPWHSGIPDSPNVTQDLTNYGVYVTATANSEVSSLGWYADVPAGQVIGANIYAAAGNVRGALLSSGTILSGQGGKRWHDIPLSTKLVTGQDYDLEIDIGQVDAWDCWKDTGDKSGPPLPYNAYGLLSVRNGESEGDPSNYCIIDMRIGACSQTTTGVHAGPTVTPKFTLHDAYPNPFSGSAKLAYELDKASSVSVAIYDVAGRKVADVMRSKSMPAGAGQLNLDAGKLASGVYFVKLSTPSKSVTRKITIIR